MKRIIYFILNNLSVIGLCVAIVLTDCSTLFGQIVQTGELPVSDTTPIYQAGYNPNAHQIPNTSKTPIQQIQYLAPTVSENEPVEPIPLPTHQSGFATMTRRSNPVVPLPLSTDKASATMVPAKAVSAERVPAGTVSITAVPATTISAETAQTATPQIPTTVATTTPPVVTPATEPNPIFGQYLLPQPLTSSPFLLVSHPQKTSQTPEVQFSAPVLPEAITVKPIPTVSTAPVSTVPAKTVPAAPAPLPATQAITEPVPQSPPKVPATPTRLIATESVTKNHRLRNVNSETFEQKLTEKLGKRFVPVRNIETSSNLSRFRLPVKDGTDVELSIDRQNGITTIIGSASMVESCLQIVRLLDSQENTEFIPIQPADRGIFRQAAQILNRETQKLAQNTPTLPRGDRPSANFVMPNTATPNTAPQNAAAQNTATPNTEQTAGGIVGPVQIDIIEGMDEMVIRGTPKDVAIIRDILRQIETMSLEHEPIIELVPMQHADSYRICQMVQQLYSQVYLARKGNITMLPLIKPNTILIIGKQESIDAAKELIAKLDAPVAPESEFQIFRLKNASSDTLQTQITQFYSNRPDVGQGLEPRISVVSDARTNALIVQANPRDMVEIAAMIVQLDSEGSDAINIVKTFPLKNAIASELATTLQNAISGTASATTGGGGFGGFGGGFGASGSQNTRTRNPMVSMGTIDKDGNLQRANVLYDVRVVADTRSNMLIVTAPPNSMPLIEALIKQLDQLPSAESQIKVFTLVNGDAYTLTTVLTQLFAQTSTSGGGFGGGTQSTSQMATVRPGIEEGESTLVSVRFQTDTRTNSIIACGSAGDMAVVEALLIRLDEENMNNRKIMILKPLNSRASEIATVINDYATNERQLEIQNSSMYLPQSPQEQYRKEIICVADDVTNALIISTTPRYYDQIRKMVLELDERPLMVAIQVLIAEVRMTNNRDRGIEFGLQDSLLFDRSLLSNTTGGLNPGFLFGDPSLGLPLGTVRTGTVGTQGITSLGTGRAGESGISGFTFSASSESVSVLVRALEEQGKLRVLSRPFLTTLHNRQAKVSVGQEVPYITSSDTSSYSGNTVSQVDYKNVGTILDILPRVTADGQIVMAVNITKSNVGSIADGIPIMVSDGVPLNAPKFNSTNAITTVSAMDGQTIVFAGLITEQKETVNRSIPGLNKIPVLKHFFEYNSVKCERNELLIVLTPTIIRSENDMQILRQQEASRMHWCINDVVKLTGNSKMKIRGDEWSPDEVPYIPVAPVILDESQLPSDEKVKQVLPFPRLAPGEEK